MMAVKQQQRRLMSNDENFQTKKNPFLRKNKKLLPLLGKGWTFFLFFLFVIEIFLIYYL